MCFKWSENSVRFENLMGISFQKAQILCDLTHSVSNGMYEVSYQMPSDLRKKFLQHSIVMLLEPKKFGKLWHEQSCKKLKNSF